VPNGFGVASVSGGATATSGVASGVGAGIVVTGAVVVGGGGGGSDRAQPPIAITDAIVAGAAKARSMRFILDHLLSRVARRRQKCKTGATETA
jgi:hypothetical protein